ncbi:MAG: ribbon-helix-helix protein, CopG family [Mycobacteriales bacterium]
MKAAISVPDPTFEAASRRARELGMSRSEFFSRAAAHYLTELDAASLTARIDAALEVAADEETETAVVHASRRALLAADEEW